MSTSVTTPLVSRLSSILPVLSIPASSPVSLVERTSGMFRRQKLSTFFWMFSVSCRHSRCHTRNSWTSGSRRTCDNSSDTSVGDSGKTRLICSSLRRSVVVGFSLSQWLSCGIAMLWQSHSMLSTNMSDVSIGG